MIRIVKTEFRASIGKMYCRAVFPNLEGIPLGGNLAFLTGEFEATTSDRKNKEYITIFDY